MKSFSERPFENAVFYFHAPWIDGRGLLLYTEITKERQLKYSKLKYLKEVETEMDSYVTGQTVRRLREKAGFTQSELAERLCVTAKAVSKWETGKGLPDISLIEPISKALGVSVTELLSGNEAVNKNVSANMLKSKIYVCPVCGNIIHTLGEASVCCCGVNLPCLSDEQPDGHHAVTVEKVEDECFVTVDHPMEKGHYISFLAYVTADRFEMIKLYPEGAAHARFRPRGRGILYIYCNRHGLMSVKI